MTSITSRDGDWGCRACGSSLRGSPSDDFCSEDCQSYWYDRTNRGVKATGRAASRATGVVPYGRRRWSDIWPTTSLRSTTVRVSHDLVDYTSFESGYVTARYVPELNTVYYTMSDVRLSSSGSSDLP